MAAKREYVAVKGIIWSSIWAYFWKQNELIGLIPSDPNRMILWARICPVNGNSKGIFYDGADGVLRFGQTGEIAGFLDCFPEHSAGSCAGTKKAGSTHKKVCD